jgi:Ca2+-binding RTX toxin-like protein
MNRRKGLAGAGLGALVGMLAIASSAAALVIIGTDGDDEIVGSPADDYIAAKAGNDTVHALGGPDAVRAGDGNDGVDLGAGRDRAGGGTGDDRIGGGPDSDLIFAMPGVDSIGGGPGDDSLWALVRSDVPLEGADSLDAGVGNDRLHARDGEADQITCGEGRDRALLDDLDVITDASTTDPNGSCEKVRRAPVDPADERPELDPDVRRHRHHRN